jgi:hypothetical protein
MLEFLNPYDYIRGPAFWSWMGTLYLIFLTYKDYKNKRIIDDRHNYLMLGASIALLSHISRNLLYMLLIMVVIIGLRWYLNKFKVIGEADINALSWIFLGFGIINIFKLAWFGIFFIIITAFYTGLKFYVFKYKEDTPFFQVILISFWFNCLIFGLY